MTKGVLSWLILVWVSEMDLLRTWQEEPRVFSQFLYDDDDDE